MRQSPQARATGPRLPSHSPASKGDQVRSRILELAQGGDLIVPMAGTFEFDDTPAAFAVLTGRRGLRRDGSQGAVDFQLNRRGVSTSAQPPEAACRP
jgi:hypothetical protein